MPQSRSTQGFNVKVEGLRFLRYEIRSGSVVALFNLDAPTLDWGAGEPRWTHDLVLNRASLETRLSNLQAAGYQAEVTAAVLKGWPLSSADLPGDGVPAHASMQSADRQAVAISPDEEGRAAPRTRLIVHGKLVTTDQHLECVIVDLSATGAQLSLEASVTAPPVALLHLPNGLVHAVQRRWQRDTLAGYAFLSVSEAGDLAVPPSTQESTTLEVQRNRRWRRLSGLLGLSTSKIRGFAHRRYRPDNLTCPRRNGPSVM